MIDPIGTVDGVIKSLDSGLRSLDNVNV